MSLPPVDPNSNKYTRGSLLVIAGSRRFPGSAVLAAMAAERTGAGYTTLAVPESVVQVAQAHLLSVPVVAAAETEGCFAADALHDILLGLRHVDTILIGPGLTVTKSTALLLEELFSQATCPLVLDADALNLLSAHDQQGQPLWQSLPAGTILTPHSGELARLLESTGAQSAASLAQMLEAVLVHKDHETYVFSPDPDVSVYAYHDGTAALAKAGTGDVLAGIIASLRVQGATAWDAATLGVQIHGLAGRFAEMNGSRRSVTPRDLVDILPISIREIEG
ncbi:MAG: NAD(P)H-hydrate dehydratase [Coriobacteriia bacterium]|nr:NAD(P)H-hydrate dehydratase [Coriobacteriia bacterium]